MVTMSWFSRFSWLRRDLHDTKSEWGRLVRAFNRIWATFCNKDQVYRFQLLHFVGFRSNGRNFPLKVEVIQKS